MTWLKRNARRRSIQGAMSNRRRVAFEVFEERVLLSTFQVVNNNDSGVGSLRAAINSANSNAGADDIEFDSGLGVITAVTALPTVTGVTRFNTLTPTAVTVDGGGGAFDGLTLGAGSGGSRIHGMTLQNFGSSIIHVLSDGNTIDGDTIGSAGGSNQIGILIDGASSNIVGGTTAAAANTIGFSQTAGIQILGALAANNVIEGNFVGTNATNADLGNAFGIQIVNSNGNTVGGAAAGAANTIGFNTTAGVSVLSGNQNLVSRNLYTSLNGPPPPNPASDVNLGPTANNGQPAPVISTASISGGQLNITYTIGLPVGTSVDLEIYQRTTAGVGQRSFITTTTTVTVAGINTVSIPVGAFTNGDEVLATATVAANGTSVFSNFTTIADQFTVTNNNPSGVGSLFQALTNSNNTAGANVINITFAAGVGVILVSPLFPLPVITHPVFINFTDTSGITVDGGGLVQDGFILGAAANNSTIRGLSIVHFVQSGIHIFSSTNTIIGNTIGASGAGNGIGVFIDGGSSNIVGGAGAEANTIGFNTTAGISVLSGSLNVFSQNLYVGTNGPATPVSASDINLATNANNNQPAPALATASLAGSSLTLTFTIGAPLGSTDFEIYKLDTNTGERIFLGSATQPTVAGINSLSITINPLVVQNGDQIVATATVAANGTSVFSNVATIADQFNVTNNDPNGVGSLFQVLTNVNNSPPGANVINVTFGPGVSVILVSPQYPLPVITHSVFINSTNASGITVDGGGLVQDGFILGAAASNSRIQGLTIVHFVQSGIHIFSSTNTIIGNTIGASGAGNGIGVFIDGGSSNTVGGSGASANTIGFNSTAGISVLSGNLNVFSQNLYSGANGPLIPADPGPPPVPAHPNPAGDISLATNANNNLPAPVLATAFLQGNDLTLTFSIALPIGTSLILEVYKVGALGVGPRTFVLESSPITTVAGNNSITFLNVSGVGSTDEFLATARVASYGTSEFSNVIPTADPYRVTNSDASGIGSLFQVLTNVNNSAPGANVINVTFAAVGVILVSPRFPLPVITHSVFINSTNASDITVDGGGLVQDGFILGLGARNSKIQGLTIIRFAQAGIHIYSDDNTIIGNTIGTSGNGNTFGILIDGGSSNTIGGATATEANTIGVNSAAGIQIIGAQATSNLIAGNYIGTDGADTDLHNGYGVQILNAFGNTVGVDSTQFPSIGAANTIGFNSAAGVLIQGGAGNRIAGNYIGTNGSSADLHNGVGVLIGSSSGNTIGGTTSDARNVIGFNTTAGISVLSGNTNKIRQNLYIGNNGPIIPDDPGPPDVPAHPNPATDITLGADANNKQASPHILSASLFGSILFLQINGLQSSTTLNLEVYQLTDATIGRRTYVASATLPAENASGIYLVAVDLGATPTLQAHDRILATVADDSTGEDATGTSAFSNSTVILASTVVVNTYNSDYGSLAYAIMNATGTGLTTITFAIPTDDPGYQNGVWTIRPTVAQELPAIEHQVWINGESQPKPNTNSNSMSPLVWISGDQITSGVHDGLRLQNGSEGSIISGLGIIGFNGVGPNAIAPPSAGIHASFTGNGPHAVRIINCFIGVDPALNNPGPGLGTANGIGIFLENARGSQVGGSPDEPSPPSPPNHPNYIGFNTYAGIRIQGGGSNIVQSNYIGATANKDFGNGIGVEIRGGSSNNLIGGQVALVSGQFASLFEGNLIGSNSKAGVSISGAGSTGNLVLGNYIGVDPFNPTQHIPRNLVGVVISDASSNFVGGFTDQNDGSYANVIGNSTESGIAITGSSQWNFIQRNYIGMDRAYNNLGNGLNGILLSRVSNNLIGGHVSETVDSNGNVISTNDGFNIIGFNKGDGIQIAGSGSNVVQGNYVGVSTTGFPLANGKNGIELSDGANMNLIGPGVLNHLGSASVAAANFIASNILNGILITSPTMGGQLTALTQLNRIVGNVIGAYVFQSYSSTGNLLNGVSIDNGYSNTVGGPRTGQPFTAGDSLASGVANLILGNGNNGVLVNSTLLPTGNTDHIANIIQGNQLSRNVYNGVKITGNLTAGTTIAWVADNFVGTDFTGMQTFEDITNPNPSSRSYGNGLSGILLEATTSSNSSPMNPSVFITGNVVSGNGLSGITAQHAGANYLSANIASNIIGLNKVGRSAIDGKSRPIGNVLDGIRIDNVLGLNVGPWNQATPPTAVGGPNVISGNLGRGVEIVGNLLTVFAKPTVDPTNPTPPADPIIPSGDNKISGNLIGTDILGGPGDGNLGNLSDGLFLLAAADTQISGNTIGNNRASGLHLATQPPDSNHIQKFGAVTIAGNKIGTDDQGRDLYNGSDGIFLDTIQNATISGNVISKNRANGVDILSSTQIELTGNQIGSNTPGAIGNYANGVFLNGSGLVTIGGAKPEDANIISGNQASGVFISGNDAKASGNKVIGNKIGTDKQGDAAVPNSNSGVVISLSRNNVIGGETTVAGTGLGNMISGNQLYGVLIAGNHDDPASSGLNTIEGNLIGSNSMNKSKLGNSADGVFLLNTQNNSIGGVSAMQGNVISGNSAQGVRLFGDVTAGNLIAGNFVGLSPDGRTPVPNRGNGVIIDNVGAYNIVGPRNVISGNGQSGIMVGSTLGADASGTWIFGNLIGTDSTGTSPVGNGGSGVLLFGASNIVIGNRDNDLYSTYRNVISSNKLDGVQIYSPAPGAPADNNIVRGNYIGTDVTGTQSLGSHLGNSGDGVQIINGSNNVIGGSITLPNSRNVISGNTNGVTIYLQTGRTDAAGNIPGGNVLSGNLIGTDATGVNPLGNTLFGVLLNNAKKNLIGMPGTGSIQDTHVPALPSNVISGNNAVGVEVTGDSNENTIQGNFIGVSLQGAALDNNNNPLELHNLVGVVVDANAYNNIIGGSASGTGNIITQSGVIDPNQQDAGYVGVTITTVPSGKVGNKIQGNIIGLDANNQVGANKIGVLLNNGQNVQVGGNWLPTDANKPLTTGAGNVISGNRTAGVVITGQFASGNLIYNNYIGTDTTGTHRVGTSDVLAPAQESGVLIDQGTGNLIGAGSTLGGSGNAGNVISGNLVGVNIANQTGGGANTSANEIRGNKIGTDVRGTTAVPNLEFGVFITASANNKIDGNLISANGVAGVEIFGGASQLATVNTQGPAAGLGTVITNNLIGTNVKNELAFPPYNGAPPSTNPPLITLPDGLQVYYGYQLHGVVVIGASNNTVGASGAGNWISGNIDTGVYISKNDNTGKVYATPNNNSVQYNTFNTDGIYGVYRYDSPNGNPVAESPAANANTFTGTPIPLGDFVTGFNQTGLPGQQAQSILLANTTNQRATPTRTAPVTVRPKGPMRRKASAATKLQTQAKALSAASPSTTQAPRVPQLIQLGSKARRIVS